LGRERLATRAINLRLETALPIEEQVQVTIGQPQLRAVEVNRPLKLSVIVEL
jgi:hypothetical protein